MEYAHKIPRCIRGKTRVSRFDLARNGLSDRRRALEEEEEEDRKNEFRAAHSRRRFHKKRALTGIVGLSTLAIRIPLFLYKQTEKTLISGDIC